MTLVGRGAGGRPISSYQPILCFPKILICLYNCVHQQHQTFRELAEESSLGCFSTTSPVGIILQLPLENYRNCRFEQLH